MVKKLKKQLYRSESERLIGGVAGGIAEYFKIDPTIVRLIFAASLIPGGGGGLVYLVLWMVIPTKSKIV